jgi:hypothetical protein
VPGAGSAGFPRAAPFLTDGASARAVSLLLLLGRQVAVGFDFPAEHGLIEQLCKRRAVASLERIVIALPPARRSRSISAGPSVFESKGRDGRGIEVAVPRILADVLDDNFAHLVAGDPPLHANWELLLDQGAHEGQRVANRGHIGVAELSILRIVRRARIQDCVAIYFRARGYDQRFGWLRGRWD